jgi:5'-nucleotidase (lipoprotein e(P4) family)
MRTIRLISVGLFFLVFSASANCLNPKQMTQYHQKNYQLELNISTRYAKQYLDHITRHNHWRKPPAIVFDLDETILTNWPELLRSKFVYQPKMWRRWVAKATAKAIEPTFAIAKEAQKKGINVIFISGRPEGDRSATITNLHRIGLTRWSALMLTQSDQERHNICETKAQKRARLSHHYQIIMNVGDQYSDFCGRHNGVMVKLPNPFYKIPAQNSRMAY